MRIVDQNTATRATAASATVVFTAQDFDAANVVKLGFLFTGAGMTVGDLTRIRVKNAGITSHDMSLAQFQAWYQKYFGVAPVAGDVSFDIPFHLPNVDNDNVDMSDLSQMVQGQQPSIELQIGAGGAAGTVQMSWVKNPDVKPKMFPILFGSQMQIAASQPSAHYNLSEPGAIKGVILPTTGLTRARLELEGRRRFNIEGTTLYAQLQRERNAQVVTDPIAFDLGGPQSGPSGSSGIEIETAVGWAGVANEIALYAHRAYAA